MAEAPIPGDDLEPFLVLRGDVVLSPPHLLQLVFLEAEEPQTTGIVLVSLFKDRYLVAVPSAVWHRKQASRKLPAGALVRPLAIEVPVFTEAADVEAEFKPSCRVWLGWLSADLLDSLVIDFEEEEVVYNFVANGGDITCLPSSQSLVEAAREKFGVQGPEIMANGPAALPASSLEPPVSKDARLDQLENKFDLLQASLDRLVALQPGGSGFHTALEDSAPPEAPPGLGPRPKRKPALKNPPNATGAQQQGGDGLEGLDPMTVQAALQAGIPRNHLTSMANLLKQRPPKLGDYPQSTAPAWVAHPDSEVEDDAENAVQEGEDDASAPSAGSIPQAVIQLTKIVGELAAGKKKSGGGSLEDALNAVGGSVGSTDQHLSTGRKHAAAVLALKKTLREKPELIYRSIEANMQEDFNLTSQAPNSGVPTVTARGWLEHRSRVQAFPRTVRWTWGVAGVLDCLINNRPGEARARAALMLAQADQEAIDHGGWILAGEFALEPAAPISSFVTHSIPDPLELQYSRLIDARWVEAFVGKLKEADDYLERRKKLGSKQFPAPNLPPGKGNPGGKGKGKKGKENKGDGAPPALE